MNPSRPNNNLYERVGSRCLFLIKKDRREGFKKIGIDRWIKFVTYITWEWIIIDLITY